ncbi:hypothetical protein COLO4_03636 [Corchorus olitorius]|uniref:F-box domain-containing protein n=1 Tax=Corchorus olitorius TaxID=93759 RepID=A0A1R3KXR1_9ROSI|nr:hypothetical protein COLO4_03636 [Corchorus olitorius]
MAVIGVAEIRKLASVFAFTTSKRFLQHFNNQYKIKDEDFVKTVMVEIETFYAEREAVRLDPAAAIRIGKKIMVEVPDLDRRLEQMIDELSTSEGADRTITEMNTIFLFTKLLLLLLLSKELDDSIFLSDHEYDENDPSQLPRDVVFKIANFIQSLEDFVAFSGVCKAWRSVCSNMNWKPGHQFPWLLVSDTEHNQKQSFYSFNRNKRYELELPHAFGKRCFGSPLGRIVTVSRDLEAQILHPLSRVQLNLPQLNTIIQNQNQNQMAGVIMAADPFIRKCVLFKVYEENGHETFLVAAILGPNYCLAYAKPESVQWNIVEGIDGVKDMVFYQGQLYAIFGQGKLLRFESDEAIRVIASEPQDILMMGSVERIYLLNLDLESSGHLLGVFRYAFINFFEQRSETKLFWVYRLEFDHVSGNGGTWQRLDHLGDWALFVGEGNSWSVCTTNVLNCRSSCIYFTDDNWDQHGSHIDRDIGLYDMKSNKIERLDFGSHCPGHHSRSVWFTPILRPSRIGQVYEI